MAILIPLIILIAAVVAIYHRRFDLFKRCGVCCRWPWQTAFIYELKSGMICQKCLNRGNDLTYK